MEVTRVDYIRVPVDDIEAAQVSTARCSACRATSSLQHEDWVEYEASNVTLAVMTPETHDDVFAVFPPGTIALGVPDVAAAKAELEAKGLEVGEMWDSARVTEPASATRPATGSSSTTGTGRMSRNDALAAYEELPLPDTTEEHWRFTDLRGFARGCDGHGVCRHRADARPRCRRLRTVTATGSRSARRRRASPSSRCPADYERLYRSPARTTSSRARTLRSGSTACSSRPEGRRAREAAVCRRSTSSGGRSTGAWS